VNFRPLYIFACLNILCLVENALLRTVRENILNTMWYNITKYTWNLYENTRERNEWFATRYFHLYGTWIFLNCTEQVSPRPGLERIEFKSEPTYWYVLTVFYDQQMYWMGVILFKIYIEKVRVDDNFNSIFKTIMRIIERFLVIYVEWISHLLTC